MFLPIEFLIAGAAKCGTTSLHRYLAQHPETFLPEAKELAYFISPADAPWEAQLMERF